MSGEMHRCTNPSCREYTLHPACPVCGSKAIDPRPAKFSPEDHYGVYRRKLKRLTKASPTGPAAPAPSAPSRTQP